MAFWTTIKVIIIYITDYIFTPTNSLEYKEKCRRKVLSTMFVLILMANKYENEYL